MNTKDFLSLYLDFKCFWSFEHLKNSKPVAIRSNRLHSWLKALDISKKNSTPTDSIRHITYFNDAGDILSKEETHANFLANLSELEYFERGEFINARSKQTYQELILKIQTFARVNDLEELSKRRKNRISLR